jgi:hypothetical protein
MMLKLGHVWNYIRNIWKFFYVWCWIRVEKISWTDHVRNEAVCLRVKEDR